eukprot:7295033-Prymnesium_polylepis.1
MLASTCSPAYRAAAAQQEARIVGTLKPSRPQAELSWHWRRVEAPRHELREPPSPTAAPTPLGAQRGAGLPLSQSKSADALPTRGPPYASGMRPLG